MKKLIYLLAALMTVFCSCEKGGSEENVPVGIYEDGTVLVDELHFRFITNDGAVALEVLGPTTPLLTTAVIPEAIKVDGKVYPVASIGEEAFIDCVELEHVLIPNSVTSIGRSAFYFCISLTNITIPHSVTYIGISAFTGCSNLTTIDVSWNEPLLIISAFYPYQHQMTLRVPKGTKELYAAAAGWQEFASIVEKE